MAVATIFDWTIVAGVIPAIIVGQSSTMVGIIVGVFTISIGIGSVMALEGIFKVAL